MLRVENLQVIYNEIIFAVKGVSINVPLGQIVSILGPNGAGKTSIIRAIGGILKSQEGEITEGSIYFEGNKINDLFSSGIARIGIHIIPEGGGLFDDLTVMEHLRLAKFQFKSDKTQNTYNNIFTWFPSLRKNQNTRAGYISGGERQMLALSVAVLSYPKLLVMDEPSMGLAPKIIKEIYNFIKMLNTKDGITILLVEQNANIALNVSNYGYIIENGRIVLDGPSQNLLKDRQVSEFYLGMGKNMERRSYRDIKHYKSRKRWLS